MTSRGIGGKCIHSIGNAKIEQQRAYCESQVADWASCRMAGDAEEGCHRFDIHQEAKDPTLFLLIEIYADEAAFELHRTSPHYLQFREDVKDWVVDRKWWYWQFLTPS